MTAKPARKPPALAIVSVDDVRPDPGDDLPAPTAPVLDEDSVYVRRQQDELSATEAGLWQIDTDIAAATGERDRKVKTINDEYEATMKALNSRRDTLARKQARIQAALRINQAAE